MKTPAALRWTLNKSASEFGLDRATVAKRIKAAGIVPGRDGKFSTKEIHLAICGDIAKEKLRKLQQETRVLELQNARTAGELVDAADFVKRLEVIVVNMKARIMAATMTDAEKDGCCADLAELLRSG